MENLVTCQQCGRVTTDDNVATITGLDGGDEVQTICHECLTFFTEDGRNCGDYTIIAVDNDNYLTIDRRTSMLAMEKLIKATQDLNAAIDEHEAARSLDEKHKATARLSMRIDLADVAYDQFENAYNRLRLEAVKIIEPSRLYQSFNIH